MIILQFFILLLFVVYYRKSKDLFNPIVLISLSWGVVVGLYFFANHGFYPLGNRFALCLLVWLLSFVIGTQLVGNMIVCNHSVRLNSNKKIINLYYILSSIAILMSAYQTIKLAMNSEYFFLMLRSINTGLDDNIEKSGTSINGYLCNIMTVLYLYELIKKGSEFNIKRVLFLLSLSLLMAFVTMAKTNFFVILFSSLVIINKKKKIKTKLLFISTVSFLAFCFGLQYIRSYDPSNMSSDSFFNTYILSGSVAFEHFKLLEHTTDGRLVFRLFYAIAHVLDSSIPVEPTIYDYTKISSEGGTTNVYTYMYPYYHDFGYCGVMLGGLFMGVFLMYFFKRKEYSEPAMICYAIFSSFLFLGFLGDFIITNASNSIQYIFYAHLPYLINSKKQ